jgi:outer membrane protein, heavy metal efflux system
MCFSPCWRTFVSAAWMLCWSLPNPVWSADLDQATTAPLTLADAVQRARRHNPDLATFAFRLKAEDARIDVAGQRPAPELGLQIENVLGTGRAQGFSGVEATLALSQVIELGGQRQRRQAVAGMQRSAVEIERERVQLDVLAELGRRFIHVATDQEQLALNRMATRLVVDTLAEVQRRVDAGRSPMAELHRARIAVARAEIEQEHAEHELLSSRRALAALWGEREARFAAVSAQLFELPRVADLDTLIARLEQSPDLLRYANTQRLRDAEAQLAKAKGQGSPTVTGGIRRLQDSSDTALVAGLSLPLFGRAQAQPAIAEATAQRDASAAAQHASRIDTEVRLFALLQELTHAITETTVLRDRVLPEMDQALVATRKAWQHGRYSAAAKAHTYHIEIERLTGTGLQPAAVAAPGAQP